MLPVNKSLANAFAKQTNLSNTVNSDVCLRAAEAKNLE